MGLAETSAQEEAYCIHRSLISAAEAAERLHNILETSLLSISCVVYKSIHVGAPWDILKLRHLSSPLPAQEH